MLLPLEPSDQGGCNGFDSFFDPLGCAAEGARNAGEQVMEEIREEVSQAASEAASNALNDLAQSVNESVHLLLKNMVLWITDVDAIDLTSGSAATTISRMDYLLSPIVIMVAVLGVLAAAVRMVLTRKANPLIPLGGGLLVAVIVQAIGVGLANLLMQAGDAWSSWVLEDTMTDQLEDRLVQVMTFGQYDGSGPVDEGTSEFGMGASALLMILLGIIVLIITVVQMILMVFREAVIIILAALLPLASVGMMLKSTQGWLPRIGNWMLALIFYKPTVAMVYATSFVFIAGDEAPTLRTYIAGLMMLLLSLFAMKALTSLFSWATGAVASPGGFSGMSGFAAGATGAAVGLGTQLRNQTSSTSERLGSPDAGSGSSGSPAPTGAQETSLAKPGEASSGSSSTGSPSTSSGSSPQGAEGATKEATTPTPVSGATGSGAAESGSSTPSPTTVGAAAAATTGPVGAAMAAAAKGAEVGTQAARQATAAVTDAGGLSSGGTSTASAQGAIES